MVPTNNISVFLRHNDSELRFMVIHICESLDYPGTIEDIVQDIYVKFLTSDVLQNYNRHFCRGNSLSAQMSTYLYPILKNYILSRLKSPDYRFMKARVSDYDPFSDEVMDMDKSLSINTIAGDFKDILHRNGILEPIDGIEFDIHHFESHFAKSRENRKYDFRKNKKREAETPECTLLEIFKYLYQGYSNKEIARIYGVSDMTITNMKHRLADAMMKYGFGEEEQVQNDRIEMPEVSVEY